MTTVTIVKNDTASKEALSSIFNATENPIACANYADGTHCTEARIDAKINIWGKRAEGKAGDACMVARIVHVDGEPAAMFNIGATGSPPTVIDKTHEGTKGSVYEFSGLMVKDKFFQLDQGIARAVMNVLSTCKTDEGYTKAILSIAKDSHEKNFLIFAGGIELTKENITSQLGENSLHPERFKLENGQSYECSKSAL